MWKCLFFSFYLFFLSLIQILHKNNYSGSKSWPVFIASSGAYTYKNIKWNPIYLWFNNHSASPFYFKCLNKCIIFRWFDSSLKHCETNWFSILQIHAIIHQSKGWMKWHYHIDVILITWSRWNTLEFVQSFKFRGNFMTLWETKPCHRRKQCQGPNAFHSDTLKPKKSNAIG